MSDHLLPLDYCFYCRGHIPDWTFPHICGSCLEIIRGGGQPVTKMIQTEFNDDDSVNDCSHVGMVDGAGEDLYCLHGKGKMMGEDKGRDCFHEI